LRLFGAYSAHHKQEEMMSYYSSEISATMLLLAAGPVAFVPSYAKRLARGKGKRGAGDEYCIAIAHATSAEE
jgi:hypothetical protein